MAKLKLKILAEDIKMNNYWNANECPITKALHRAGRTDLIECVGVYKKGEPLFGDPLVTTDGYEDLRAKLFGMLKSINPNVTYAIDSPPIPIEDFEYDLMLPDDLVIDKDIVKSTQVEFVEKKK